MRLSERTSRSSSGSDRSPRASVVMGIMVSAGVYTLRGFRSGDAVEQTVGTEGRWRTTEPATGVSQDTSGSKGETRWWSALSEGDDIEGRERRSSDPNEGNTHEEWRPRERVTGERETKKHSELEEATLGGEGVRRSGDVNRMESVRRNGRDRPIRGRLVRSSACIGEESEGTTARTIRGCGNGEAEASRNGRAEGLERSVRRLEKLIDRCFSPNELAGYRYRSCVGEAWRQGEALGDRISVLALCVPRRVVAAHSVARSPSAARYPRARRGHRCPGRAAWPAASTHPQRPLAPCTRFGGLVAQRPRQCKRMVLWGLLSGLWGAAFGRPATLGQAEGRDRFFRLRRVAVEDQTTSGTRR